ncbi:hypothetical protein DM01DRAFT_1350092 [Hesseltinella vesiculosa]|uniref:EamA domain-containing protein n=1 Tax=Hesseltinella vesiculosa TaxID=101127 RepID=A0A1X2G2N5_9FUNG|nr:hypothetical protein DM01DRAFT_1350092 [Hesseltinella vesiculosa]
MAGDERTPLLAPPVTTNDTTQQEKKKELFGLLIMTLSALGFSVMSLLVSITGKSFPSFEIVFARSIVQAVLGLAGCAWLKINPLGNPKIRPWLAFRGLAGAVGLALFFYSLTHLPLADATGPVFTAILASIVLHEPFTLFDMGCACVSFVGIIFVSKPNFIFGGQDGSNASGWDRLFAILCALIGAVMSAFAYVTVRRIGKGAHFMVHVVYFGIISTFISALGLFLWQDYVPPSDKNDYVGLVLVGVAAFIGQCLLNKGLQLAPAGKATLCRNVDVVFAFLFGILILGEYPDAYSITGATLIAGATTTLGLHKCFLFLFLMQLYQSSLYLLLLLIAQIAATSPTVSSNDVSVEPPVESYLGYLKRQIVNVNVNELQVNHGKRLPILCSLDDYYYVFAHVLPHKLKTIIIERTADLHTPPDHIGRHELFYHKLHSLPASIQQQALRARFQLEQYLRQVPVPIDDLLAQHQLAWDDLGHRVQRFLNLIEEKYHSNDLQTPDLQLAWNDYHSDINTILRQQVANYDSWKSMTDKGFVQVATTFGPLRQVVEAIYIDALDQSVRALNAFSRQNSDLYLAWLDTFWTQVQLTMTDDRQPSTTLSVHEFVQTCQDRLDQITQQRPSLSKVRYDVDQTWRHVVQDISYSRWQWLYWTDLWQQIKVHIKKRTKAFIRALDQLVPDE